MADEITIKDLFLKIRKLWKTLLSKWLLISIFGISFGVGGIILAYKDTPTYTANLTFVLENQESGNALGSYAGLASQFGIGGMGGGNIFSEDNLQELLKSRLLIEQALLREVPFSDGKDMLINRYIKMTKLDKQLQGKKDFDMLKFTPEQEREKFHFIQDSVLYIVQNRLTERHINISQISKSVNIIRVKCETKDQEFSKYFTQELVESVTNFYINHKTQRAREALEFAQNRVDSVFRVLLFAEASFAEWKDSQFSLIKAEGSLKGIRLKRDVELLNVMYGEVIKNLELTKMTLLNRTPLVKIIDQPRFPLVENKLSKTRTGLIGGVLGGFLICGFILIRTLIREVMEAEEPK